jgi:hypothetical protein
MTGFSSEASSFPRRSSSSRGAVLPDASMRDTSSPNSPALRTSEVTSAARTATSGRSRRPRKMATDRAVIFVEQCMLRE